MNLLQDQTNSIYKLCQTMLSEFRDLVVYMAEDNQEFGIEYALKVSLDFVNRFFSKHNTVFKRQQSNLKNPAYVPIEEKAIGTHWEVLPAKCKNISVPRLIQSKFAYVSIIQSLQSMFENEQFRKAYFEYNAIESQKKHTCSSGVYKDICCGSSYQKNELFSSDPTSVKIMLSSDDFEVCNPIGSKSTIHKLCAVYMSIRNFPIEFNSKLNEIRVIALCNVDDLKTRETDFNDIWHLIVNEIKVLETVGIYLSDNVNVRGSLASVTFDNLGASICLGFAEGSNSCYYCRICELPKSECQKLCAERITSYRNKESYNRHLQIIANSESVNYKETKGIKRNCLLNELKYFHVLENPFVDPMHDLNEGIIRDLLSSLFNFCVSEKVISKSKLIHKFQFYDYGCLKKKDLPSAIILDKVNLNQNASQIMCLLQHVPLVLIEFESNTKIQKVWSSILSLIKIAQIVYSMEVTESDLGTLDQQIFIHLNAMQNCFSEYKSKLKPKHHHMTHYSNIIRQMGPTKPMSMIRFESKHQQLKSFMKISKNYINIPKSILSKHQDQIQFNKPTYQSEIRCGKESAIDIEKQTVNMSNYFAGPIYDVKWFELNQYHYMAGLLVQHEKKLLEIQHCIKFEGECFFSGHEYQIHRYKEFSNSFCVKKLDPIREHILRFSDLTIKTLYELKHINNETHIISDDLSLPNLFKQLQNV